MTIEEQCMKEFNERMEWLIAEVRAYKAKPLTQQDKEEMLERARNTPEVKRVNREISQLKAIARIFEK